MIVKLGGKLKAWLAQSGAVARVKKHLPSHIRARRGPAGRVRFEGGNLSYEAQSSQFSSSQEMASYMASKIPGGAQ
jgi:hypothetical protein